jgi:hypothetical protein
LRHSRSKIPLAHAAFHPTNQGGNGSGAGIQKRRASQAVGASLLPPRVTISGDTTSAISYAGAGAPLKIPGVVAHVGGMNGAVRRRQSQLGAPESLKASLESLKASLEQQRDEQLKLLDKVTVYFCFTLICRQH